MTKNILIREDLSTGVLSVDFNSKHKKIHGEAQEGLIEVYEVSISDKVLKVLNNPTINKQEELSKLIK